MTRDGQGDRFDFRGHAAYIDKLQQEFSSRFGDFRTKKPLYNLFSLPFTVDVDCLATEYQLEVIDLQSSSSLRAVHNESADLKELYKCLDISKYLQIVHNALKLVSVLEAVTFVSRHSQ